MTPPGSRIEEMWCFAIIDDDDREGVPAFMSPGGMWMPMVGADPERVETLMEYAQDLATELGKPVNVYRFTNRETVETIQP